MTTANRDNFKVLDDREWALKRPAVLIGSVTSEEVSGFFDGEYKTISIIPGLLKIINEIIDNSIDEYVRTDGKFANKIDIKIENNPITGSSISVQDNGRGIPVEKVDGEYRPVLAWTRARAGSNFGDDADRTTIGMNGVGAFCTNVFSTKFIGETSDGKNKLILNCSDNAATKDVSVRKNSARYTKVEFFPDLKLFKIDEIGFAYFEFIQERLMNIAATYPGITFTLNNKRIKFQGAKKFSTRFNDNMIVLDGKDGFIALGPSGSDEEFRLHSYVNGLHIKNGGIHVDYIMYQISEHLRPLIKKKHKIEVLPNQIKQHLLLVTVLRGISNLKFDSQTKERITNSKTEMDPYLGKIDYAALARKILANEEIIDPIIAALLAKKAAAERLALARKQKKMKKVRIAKHVEAQHKDPEKKILFVSEGDSAAGRLASLRNSQTVQTVGGYPLRGKVMNTYGMKPTDVIKNKELSELMAVIGLDFAGGKQALNYGKIAIMTDMDTDGDAIACLLVNFFSNWKELFEQGRIFRVLSPLVIARKRKKEKVFYTYEDYAKEKLDNSWEIQYMKGLGSLPKEAYREMINNPVLVPIKLDDSGKLEVAFGPDSSKRKDWLLSFSSSQGPNQ